LQVGIFSLAPALADHGGDWRLGVWREAEHHSQSYHWLGELAKGKVEKRKGEETGIKRRESGCREMLGQIWSAPVARVY